MLSHPLEEGDWAALDFAEFSAVWKWDGIRVQIVAGRGEAQLYSRTGDAVSQAFPDVVAGFNFDAVLDGELLVLRKGEASPFNVAPFNDLQQRLNRKTVSKKQLEQFPAHVRLYDVLAIAGEDLRALPSSSAAHASRPGTQGTSPAYRPVAADRGHGQAGAGETVGRHPRHRHRRHHAEAPRQPLRRRPPEGPVVQVEARAPHPRLRADVCPARLGQALVLLLRLHVRQLGVSGDKAAPELVPVGKALLRLHRRGAAGDRPLGAEPHHRKLRPGARGRARPGVRVAFDAVQKSTRHKSGVAMRFPRIHRIRWDKPADEADRLDTLVAMIEA
jgi:DNA ligase-1